MSLPVALAVLPTLVWCLICLWIRPSEVSLRWLISGLLLGAAIGGPIWLAESAIDGLANPNDRFSRDFIQQVLGAAFCEETLKFIAIGVLLWFAGLGRDHHSRDHLSREVVTISVSVAIGFMTLENLFGVYRSGSTLSLALDRQLTIFAGHPSYQVIMGTLLAVAIQRRRVGWAIAALALPMLLHGWADLSEQLFRDETNPGSVEDSTLYFAWLASIAVTACLTFYLLWSLMRPDVSSRSTSD